MKASILISFILGIQVLSAQSGADFVNNYFANDNSSRIAYTGLQADHLDSLMAMTGVKSFIKSSQIGENEFRTFNAAEHFFYAFRCPESYSQSCSFYSASKKIIHTIPSYLKVKGEGFQMSSRQIAAIAGNRDSTLSLIMYYAQTDGYHDDFKHAVILLDAFELIPDIIEKAKINGGYFVDPYLLTSLCLLMKNNYEPFQNSKIYRQLYPDRTSEDFASPRHELSIPFTQLNYNLIINYAKRYYQWKLSQPDLFVKIMGGNFVFGAPNHPINPNRLVEVNGFEIARYETTNRQFNTFVKSTGYITLAEMNRDALVFRPGLNEFEWIQDSTANWKYPNGKSQGGIDDKMDHPVTCISYIDVQAYCTWARVRLPTIEEWEVAARANSSTTYFFGDTNLLVDDYANIWKGKSHLQVYGEEEYTFTSPIARFKPNPYGLYDIYGNVFEFCSNLPEAMTPYDNIAATRGGSWWCSKTSCNFFNSVDIGRVQKEASFSNNGFRVVRYTIPK